MAQERRADSSMIDNEQVPVTTLPRKFEINVPNPGCYYRGQLRKPFADISSFLPAGYLLEYGAHS